MAFCASVPSPIGRLAFPGKDSEVAASHFFERSCDPDHSIEEQRFIIVGMSKPERLLIVAHADRNDRIRVISARITTKREKKL
ncbi:MAG: BrnT family toxin [Candidatus Acidiferrales bacterium]